MKVFDAPLGVITNAPSYDWHETNLAQLHQPVAGRPCDGPNESGWRREVAGQADHAAAAAKRLEVEVLELLARQRPTPTGDETIYEIFRILDNFNVPLGASEGTGDDKTAGMRSSTIWTSASDTNDNVFYYHTQHNRRVREVDLKKIDFSALSEIVHLPLDKVKAQDIEDVTPQAH